ncbi:MAG: hypothetical protein V3V78_00580 [Candidatus Woesearchaeota archaeon]
MNKKAQVETLVVVLVAIALSIVVGSMGHNFLSQSRGKAEVEICRLSMEKVKSIEKSKVLHAKFNCPAPSNTYQFDHENKYYDAISQNLKDCWYKTLGHESPYGDLSFTVDKETCFVCSEFVLDKEISVSETLDYMQLTKTFNFLDTSWKAPNNQQYFIGARKQDDKRRAYPLSVLEKDQNYVTLFVYSNKEWSPWDIPLVRPVGWELQKYGGKELYHHTFVIPADEINNLGCEMYYYQKIEEK